MPSPLLWQPRMVVSHPSHIVPRPEEFRRQFRAAGIAKMLRKTTEKILANSAMPFIGHLDGFVLSIFRRPAAKGQPRQHNLIADSDLTCCKMLRLCAESQTLNQNCRSPSYYLESDLRLKTRPIDQCCAHRRRGVGRRSRRNSRPKMKFRGLPRC